MVQRVSLLGRRVIRTARIVGEDAVLHRDRAFVA